MLLAVLEGWRDPVVARDVPGGPAAGARLRPRRDGGADDRRARDDNARDDNVRDDNDSKELQGRDVVLLLCGARRGLRAPLGAGTAEAVRGHLRLRLLRGLQPERAVHDRDGARGPRRRRRLDEALRWGARRCLQGRHGRQHEALHEPLERGRRHRSLAGGGLRLEGRPRRRAPPGPLEAALGFVRQLGTDFREKLQQGAWEPRLSHDVRRFGGALPGGVAGLLREAERV
mmetsp:Transcript_75509/g.211649  ORF Transcript_75509/g.211649 Transcript_75509/m.211649 type:complete len:230 (+) Transcript_75509:30-719(+)